MSILILMVPMALLLGFGFVMAFLWSSSRGQFDDLVTPALRILNDENNSAPRVDSSPYEHDSKINLSKNITTTRKDIV